jgi:hypothetical protein
LTAAFGTVVPDAIACLKTIAPFGATKLLAIVEEIVFDQDNYEDWAGR